MDSLKFIKCDQFNVSDQEYLLVELLFDNGAPVKKGEILLALESSKSVIEIECSHSGFFYTRRIIGEKVRVGELLYIISDGLIDNEVIHESFVKDSPEKHVQGTSGSAKVITRKASELIEKHNLDKDIFEEDLITEKLVLDFLNKDRGLYTSLDNESSNFNKLIKIAFIGGGQGLIQALDIVYSLGRYLPTAIYDDTAEKQKTDIFNIPVVGKVDVNRITEDYRLKKFDQIIITVSTSVDFRSRVFKELRNQGVAFANLIHPTSNLGFNLTVGQGNIILAQSSVGACSVIGNNNFISAHCNIEHHNFLGDNNTFGPGVMTSGNVIIKNNVKFGTGVFIEPKVTIQSSSVVASGVIVTMNVAENSIVYNAGVKIQVMPKK